MHALHITCKPDEVDGLSAELWESGTEGLQEIERCDEVEIIAGFEDASLGPLLLERFAAYEPEWEQQPDTDWVAFTHEMWPARAVGRRLFLAPPWCRDETPTGRVRVVHNPGVASGTGEHPCTQLMLEAIENIGAKRVLDIGTGSGILAIAARQLGAEAVFGLDTDADSLATARENFELNGLPHNLVAGSAECLKPECADVVLANISGTVLLSIFDDLLRVLTPGGCMILSGFTENELKPFQQLLPNAEVTRLNEWRCVSAEISPL